MNDIGGEAIDGDDISSADEGDDGVDGGREDLSMGVDMNVEACLEEWREGVGVVGLDRGDE